MERCLSRRSSGCRSEGRSGSAISDRLISESSAKIGPLARRSREHETTAPQPLSGFRTRLRSGRRELLQRAAEIFATAAEKREGGTDLKTLHAKIGQLALEND